jgi:hypothetical protein
MRVAFIDKSERYGNIGDYLCSPRHYFAVRAKKHLTILGGGSWKDFGVAEASERSLDYDRTVIWGTGRSLKGRFLKGRFKVDPIESLPFRFWGVRDLDGVRNPQRFLPCASCLHPMLDRDAGRSTLLFLNATEKFTPLPARQALQSKADAKGWRVLFNNCSERDLYEAWREAGRVCTNSYHGAYWGLLSGREVVVAGYSSKFSSLFASLGLSRELLASYERGNSEHMLATIEGAMSKGFVRLDSYETIKREFREINKHFAASLADIADVTQCTAV